MFKSWRLVYVFNYKEQSGYEFRCPQFVAEFYTKRTRRPLDWTKDINAA